MSPAFSRDFLERVVSSAEILTFVFTFIGAAAGVTYLIANRPLKKLEAMALARERAQAETARQTLEGKIADTRVQAAKAEESAQKIAQDNIKLKGEFDRATAEAQLRQEELRQQNLATETKLEEEWKTRLELEQSLAPRIIPFQLGPEGKTSFDSLKPFAGVQVILEYVPDAEAERAAGAIAQIIELAGWTILSRSARPDRNIGHFDGVLIEYRRAIPIRFAQKTEDISGKAAEELVDFLLSNNWVARASWIQDEIPPNTIRIIVGFKPSPRFDPEWVKRMRERYRRIREEMKEREKNLPTRPPPPND